MKSMIGWAQPIRTKSDQTKCQPPINAPITLALFFADDENGTSRSSHDPLRRNTDAQVPSTGIAVRGDDQRAGPENRLKRRRRIVPPSK
jgi:hypothetical protein